MLNVLDATPFAPAGKDAVRFPRLTKSDVPIYFLRVEIEILSGHESWEDCVARICKPQPLLSPARFFA
jgi:tetraacyldisaccharide 4'-kinase